MPESETDTPLAARDPMYEREKEKYERPIVSREFILSYLENLGQPARLEDLIDELEIAEEDQEAFRRRLRAMERDGQLVRNRRGAYGIVESMELIRGTVSAHPDGFGFLVPDNGDKDLFLSPREMRKVFHGDVVLGRIVGEDRRGRLEGAVVRILERALTQVVGRYFADTSVHYVIPEDRRIPQEFAVVPSEELQPVHGQIVILEITKYPDGRNLPEGRVVEILGEHMAPGMEVEIAVRSYGLPFQWPAAVEAESAGFQPQVPESMKEGRRDLRHLPLVTIDGADAKDFDDAVYAETREEGGFRLFVAIADVATYVRPGSALDEEARKRGNSVYFPRRVIPMLPEVLSNGLCSLNPQVDRLCMVCEMELDAQGNLEQFRFARAVMRSQRRFTYDEVAAILGGDSDLREREAELVPHLETLQRLYEALARAREARGTIEFDTQETRIVYNEQGRIENIVPLQRNVAHRMIEECMLAANVCAAQFFRIHELPMLYRVHPEPNVDKIEDLRRFLGELGVPVRIPARPRSADLARVIEETRDRADASLIQTVILRSLSQAFYTVDTSMHFGLAFPAYTHFTSPIRRYPDLIVHRGIQELLDSAAEGREPRWLSVAELKELGQHCSMTERRADEASREAVQWLKCEFMLDKVGQTFTGIITGVTGFGLFVALREVYVEGLVHISTLGEDYYHFDAQHYRIVGDRSKESFQLGGEIPVRLVQVNLDERKIEFERVPPEGEGGRKRRRRH
ncbi:MULTISPECIES: ribonuclease R [Acidithiobacillus]|jgi:ribonuclease R|uniref:Ribonuclease R n=3 Tax=Acidithiobacillus caldus TaxID=33059 RepID=F9ZL63_ACICS|nr:MULTISPECIES: ribonuclease R [Acidithiobacillus]AEK57649.1 Ribonuclease R [Acidithiobacillus caldus SM-1]AIA54857.1 3'-to-5' exoribonuclease RNase R [Acidithiobacillus caldus ATCC 51756]AUW32341.1 ribonuclease R [Acidithiobacillus caldus]MBU2730830.1 ribonuclease R [Acidithiobacillus caldus]MBU2735123.1 ribonuclease R [Acidithiobacillus caldus ATCC 51756]